MRNSGLEKSCNILIIAGLSIAGFRWDWFGIIHQGWFLILPNTPILFLAEWKLTRSGHQFPLPWPKDCKKQKKRKKGKKKKIQYPIFLAAPLFLKAWFSFCLEGFSNGYHDSERNFCTERGFLSWDYFWGINFHEGIFLERDVLCTFSAAVLLWTIRERVRYNFQWS